MSKQTFDDNLKVLGLPDRAAFNAMVDMTPDTIPFKDEMLEVLESINARELADFIDAPHSTELATAFKKLRID